MEQNNSSNLSFNYNVDINSNSTEKDLFNKLHDFSCLHIFLRNFSDRFVSRDIASPVLNLLKCVHASWSLAFCKSREKYRHNTPKLLSTHNTVSHKLKKMLVPCYPGFSASGKLVLEKLAGIVDCVQLRRRYFDISSFPAKCQTLCGRTLSRWLDLV